MRRKLQTSRRPHLDQLESRYLLTGDAEVEFDPCLPDSPLGNDIHGESVATATLLPGNSERVSHVDSSGDIDVFRYKATGSHIAFIAFSINEVSLRIFGPDGEQVDNFDVNHIGSIGPTLEGYSPFASTGELVFGSIETEPGKSYFFEVSAALPTEYSVMLSTPEPPQGAPDKIGLNAQGLGADSRGGNSRESAEVLELVPREGFTVVEVGPTFVDDESDVDFYRFTSEGNDARIDLRSTYNVQFTGRLTDADGELVAELSRDGAGVERMNLEIVPNQEYTLEVRATEPTEYSVAVLARTIPVFIDPAIEDPTLGDFNNDSEIGFPDFLILSANYGKTVDVAFADGDLDGDRVVGFIDFLLFSERYGQVV